MSSRLLCVVCTVCVFALNLCAQIGDKSDKPGEVQQLLVPRELIPPAPALTPQQQLNTFQVAPGFRVELAAADPLVQDPVAMAFDPQGRMWVVEMRSYMPDLDGNGEDLPTGRVSVLEDTDGDGLFEKATVFLDQIIMPRAICLAGGGVLIGAPPKLWFCRDTDGDLKCDERTEVAGDYGIQVDPKRPELANPERAPNSPLWALDNWIYNTAYTARFRWRDGRWERGVTTFRGQWGLSQDDFGRLYYNSNSDQLRADVVPSHYLGRNPNFPRPAGANVKVPENQFVWPIRVNPGINRGYRPEMLRDGRLKEFTAACAPWIYRGDLFGPEFYGNAFVCEPTGNLVKRNLLTETHGSVGAREAYHQREFLASTDERFRPVNLCTGPDGALYVVDMYRGVVQHRISLTTYLRRQSEERGLAQPIHRGRIWRVVPEGKPAPRVAAIRVSEQLFDGEDKDEVVAALRGLAGDPAPQVQLQLALTLGQARDAQSDALLARLVLTRGDDNKFLADAVVTGLFGRELELLEKLCADPAWTPGAANADKFLATLARCVFAERKPERVERLLALVARQPATAAKRQLALLDGALAAAAATKKPVKFAREPGALADLKKRGGASLKTRVARLDTSLVWPGKPGVPPEPVIPPLTAGQQARFEQGRELYAGTCAACHQAHGLGLEGLAPPLADSEWVLGSEQRLIRIVLHGVSGPLKVRGATYNLDMPAMGVFDDEQTAAILTYIRREWDNAAPPVEPATVRQVRAAEARRADAWRQEELLKLP